MHFFICKLFPQKSPSPFIEPCLLQAGFAKRKKEELAPSRQAAKSAAAESHTERTTISLRLCALVRVKKKNPPRRTCLSADRQHPKEVFTFL
jgi:hypothetical protein